jgi:lipoprotein-releasing system ATP-binding protein
MSEAVPLDGGGPGASGPRPIVLDVQRVGKVFQTGSEELVVLEEVSFSVAAGTTVVITGESGSGKSTLLQLVGGLDTVSAGRILFKGADITRRGESELIDFRNRALGFIFQFHYLLKDFTALENVMMPGAIAGAPRSESRRRAQALLARVGLEPRAGHYPAQLSGGERQRVAVARALMNDPELILADEPTGNLDERISAVVRELLFGLVAEYRKTMILVTHASDLSRGGDEHYVLEHRRLRRR